MTAASPRSLRVAVIIPTLNESSRIGSLLAHLSSLDVSEIVVVDGGSHDDDEDYDNHNVKGGGGWRICAGIATELGARSCVLRP